MDWEVVRVDITRVVHVLRKSSARVILRKCVSILINDSCA